MFQRLALILLLLGTSPLTMSLPPPDAWPLKSATESRDRDAALTAIRAGIDLEKRDHHGRNAIHRIVVQWGDTAVIGALLDAGAALESRGVYQLTVLAASLRQFESRQMKSPNFPDHEATVLFLLERGADARTLDEYGRSLAVGAQELRFSSAALDRLVQAGAAPPPPLTLARPAPSNPPITDPVDKLHLAVISLQVSQVQELLGSGVDPNAVSAFGRVPPLGSALRYASPYLNTESDRRKARKIIELLMRRGADPGLPGPDDYGRPRTLREYAGEQGVERELQKLERRYRR